MFEWLTNILQYNAPQQGTTIKLCENLDPDADAKCSKLDEHTGSCSYYKPSDYFEGQMVSVQWQMEDSANYKSYE